MPKENVYIIKNLDIKRVKIGVSNDIKRRIITLQNAGGCRMVISWSSELLDNAYQIESLLHYEFKEFRYIGEWFNIDEDTVIQSAIKLVETNGCFTKEPIHEPIFEYQQTKENSCINVKDLNINKYQRIKPGVYMDGDGKLFSIKYRIDGTGWNVSELNQI